MDVRGEDVAHERVAEDPERLVADVGRRRLAREHARTDRARLAVEVLRIHDERQVQRVDGENPTAVRRAQQCLWEQQRAGALRHKEKIGKACSKGDAPESKRHVRGRETRHEPVLPPVDHTALRTLHPPIDEVRRGVVHEREARPAIQQHIDILSSLSLPFVPPPPLLDRSSQSRHRRT